MDINVKMDVIGGGGCGDFFHMTKPPPNQQDVDVKGENARSNNRCKMWRCLCFPDMLLATCI